MRMRQDDHWMSLPGGTIETLEYFGLSSELDRYSVQTLLHWLTQNLDVLQQLDGISLNLSARSIADGHFMDHLYDEVQALHLPPGKLGFEITETAAIDHLEIAAALVTDFKGIGCTFSLDDFGSGLCSFAYLHSLPVTEVKIDGRFLRDIADNPVSQEIVRAIHQVARATGKKTVAEFVDEPRKLAVLKTLGVDYAQGWLFHAAMPPVQFLDLLAPSLPRLA
jgi:EAL domain-containing protein (putative c-di-GMP-specific phosphodiesterase class I)